MRRGVALLALFTTLAFAGAAAASWPTGVYTGKLRSPGFGTRGQSPIRLQVSKTQFRVLSAQLSFRCPDAKGRVAVKVGPLKAVKIRVRPDTGGAQFSLNQKIGTMHVTIAGGITPGKPLQGILDATRDLPGGNLCEDSALFTARPR
jgi:hypothetical protein